MPNYHTEKNPTDQLATEQNPINSDQLHKTPLIFKKKIQYLCVTPTWALCPQNPKALQMQNHRTTGLGENLLGSGTLNTDILLHWAAAAPSEKGSHCCISAFGNLHGI